MFDLLMIISLLPYFAGIYAYRNLYFWTWYGGELGEAMIVFILFWLIGFFPVLFECLSEDGIFMKIVLGLSTMINGLVFVQHVGAWALARIITEDGFQLFPFLKMIGPLILVVFFIIYELIPKDPDTIKIDKDNVWEDNELQKCSLLLWGIGMLFGTGVILCLFNTMPETVKVGGLSISVIPGMLGYEGLPFADGSEAFAKMLSEGFVQPTWANFSEWTLRLKIVAIISLVFLILSFVVMIIRAIKGGRFFEKALRLSTLSVVYVYLVYAFLLARREVFMECFLWDLVGEAAFAFLQAIIPVCGPIAILSSGNQGRPNGDRRPSSGSVNNGGETYDTGLGQYDLAALPNRIFYNGEEYHYQSGTHPRLYRTYEGDEILIYHCSIQGDSAQTNIGQIMLR